MRVASPFLAPLPVVAPPAVAWKPTDAGAALAAHWDPSDSANRTVVNTNKLSQVNDKSGKNNHLTQGTDTLRPLILANVADWGNREAFYFREDSVKYLGSPLANNVARAYVWAIRPVGGAQRAYMALFGGQGSGGLELQFTSGGALFLVNQAVAVIGGTGDGLVPVDATVLVAAGYDPATGDWLIRTNGAARAAGTNKQTLNNTAHRMGYAQHNDGGQEYFYGTAGEAVVYGSGYTLDLIQRAEGYIAHGWNLASKLAAAHPYKSAPPTTA